MKKDRLFRLLQSKKVYVGIKTKNARRCDMIKEKYVCDNCEEEIGTYCQIFWHQTKYDDTYGQNMDYDWHFCSNKCKEEFMNSNDEDKKEKTK